MAGDVAEEIALLIGLRGRITFAQFMELALFSPRGGYYTVGPGASGRDYFTAPIAHPAFGALLAVQLLEVWRCLGSPVRFHVVEVGASSGTLAADILGYALNLSASFSQALQYVAVDYAHPNARLEGISFVRGSGLPVRGVEGCIISNELLDAFPVHRFVVQDGRLQEVYVALGDDGFVEAYGEPSTPLLEERLARLGIHPQDGFRGEINLALEEWNNEVSRALQRGLVLTIDYGHLAQDLYSPLRSAGTLRCYHGHTLSGDPYRLVGQQDMTAHVDFSTLVRLGEEQGLTTVGLTSQASFLARLGLSSLLAGLQGRPMSQRERDANRMPMLELVRPGGMGDFKVLAQARGLDGWERLTGFAQEGGDGGVSNHPESLPEVPLLSQGHLDLMGGRYPHLSWDWEQLWPFGGTTSEE